MQLWTKFRALTFTFTKKTTYSKFLSRATYEVPHPTFVHSPQSPSTTPRCSPLQLSNSLCFLEVCNWLFCWSFQEAFIITCGIFFIFFFFRLTALGSFFSSRLKDSSSKSESDMFSFLILYLLQSNPNNYTLKSQNLNIIISILVGLLKSIQFSQHFYILISRYFRVDV